MQVGKRGGREASYTPSLPEVSALVINCSVAAVERRQWRISEHWHMSGSESASGECARAACADIRPNKLHRSMDRSLGAKCWGGSDKTSARLSTCDAHPLIPSYMYEGRDFTFKVLINHLGAGLGPRTEGLFCISCKALQVFFCCSNSSVSNYFWKYNKTISGYFLY